MSFAGIRRSLENIDYSWTKPQTYLVLVPGVSLMIQKIQLATIPPLNPNPLHDSPADARSREKFANICMWHLRGSIVQITVSLIAIKIFAAPLFSLLAILATYELIDTSIKSFANLITLYKFYPDGSVGITYTSAFRFF